jgi:hypothetical protein
VAVFRYNPSDAATSRGVLVATTGGASLGSVLGDTPDAPAASESTYATTSPTNAVGPGFGPTYLAPALAPAAAAIPAGHAIVQVQVFCRLYEPTSLGYPGGGVYSSNPRWACGITDGSGYGSTVSGGGPLPLNAITWVQTPLTNMYVAPDNVAAYLATAGLFATNAEGNGIYGAVNCDSYIYGLYVKFTTRIEGEIAFSLPLTLDVSAPRVVYAGGLQF